MPPSGAAGRRLPRALLLAGLALVALAPGASARDDLPQAPVRGPVRGGGEVVPFPPVAVPAPAATVPGPAAEGAIADRPPANPARASEARDADPANAPKVHAPRFVLRAPAVDEAHTAPPPLPLPRAADADDTQTLRRDFKTLIRMIYRHVGDDRTMALIEVNRLGHRSEELVEALYRGLDSGLWSDVEKEQAVLGLGRCGDGREVESLIALLDNEDGRIRHAALVALTELTGERGRGTSTARWRRWWAVYGPRARKRVADSVQRLEYTGGADLSVRDVLIQEGWTDIPAVEAAVNAWLRSPKTGLQREACHVAGALGLADVKPRIVAIQGRSLPEDLSEAIENALTALTLPRRRP